MKKIVSVLLCVLCIFSLVACGNEEIEASIKPFPAFEGEDFEGNEMSNELFKEYDVTIVNFWSNGCGSCIEEMPELEEYSIQFKEQKINLIGVAVSAGDSQEEREKAASILKEKGVTYRNLIPDAQSDFYKDFLGALAGYPITYLVDSAGNIVGAPLVGVVKLQEEQLLKRLEMIQKGKE